MSVEKISEEKAANLIANDIQTRVGRRGGYLFLLGAGASDSCDIPVAKGMVIDLKEQLRKQGQWDESEERDHRLRDYQHVMSKFRFASQQADIIRGYIERAKAADGRWKLNHCYLVLCEIWKSYSNYPRVLLTTNFDPLFHYALLEQNIEAKLIRYFSEMEYMDPFDTEAFPSIIYLHGYWQNHHLYNNLQTFLSFRTQWVRALTPNLNRFGLVVLGYSGYPEDIAMQTLLHIHDQLGTQIDGPILWCHLERTQISNETHAVLDKLGNVFAVPIQDADSFMLRVGESLGLPQVIKIRAFASVLEELPPGFIGEFCNQATVSVKVGTLSAISNQRDVTIWVKTHPDYEKPGENYAGIEIYTVKRLFDVSKHSLVIVEYDATLREGQGGGSQKFEFKLQSREAAHIEYIPIGQGKEISLSLARYSDEGVNLGAVDRIVIAANCEQIGCGSLLEIKLKRIHWS